MAVCDRGVTMKLLLAATGVGHSGDVDLELVAVDLYGLPPDEFTAARNQAAAQARADGEAAVSSAIKNLKKPTLAAWLANQLVRT